MSTSFCWRRVDAGISSRAPQFCQTLFVIIIELLLAIRFRFRHGPFVPATIRPANKSRPNMITFEASYDGVDVPRLLNQLRKLHGNRTRFINRCIALAGPRLLKSLQRRKNVPAPHPLRFKSTRIPLE